MSIVKNLLVLLVCGCLIGACGDDKKKAGDDKAKTVEGAGKGEAAGTAAAPKVSGKPFGGRLKGLLGGGKSSAKKGGMLGGLGLGGLGEKMGGIGGAGMGATPVAKADEATSVPAGAPAAKAPEAAPAKAPTPVAGGKQCKAVADHLMKVMMKEMGAELKDIPRELAKELEKELAGAKDQVVAECESSKWPAEVHKCILKAKDMMAMMECESMMMGADVEDLEDIEDIDWEDLDMDDMPAKAEASGDAECDKLGEHVVKALASSVPAEERKMYDAMKFMVQNEVAKQCASMPFSKEARACLFKAKTDTEMEKCAEAAGLQ